MAARGDYILIKYNGVDEDFYHETLITGVISEDPTEVTLYTADQDHYQFNIAPGDDVEAVYWIGLPGGRPAHVPENQIYRFRHNVPPNERQRLFAEAQGMLGAAPAPPPAPLAAPMRNVQRQGLGRPAGAAARRAEPGRVWVFAEDHGRHQKGDSVEELPAGSVVLGERAVVPMADGSTAFLQMIPQDGIDEFKMDDLRVMPVKFDGMGRRRRLFQDGVASFVPDEPEGGLGLEGPRTVSWRCQTYVERSQTPGMMVAPLLQQHVATALRDEHQVAKEQRKAREERRLGRQNNKNHKDKAPEGQGRRFLDRATNSVISSLNEMQGCAGVHDGTPAMGQMLSQDAIRCDVASTPPSPTLYTRHGAVRELLSGIVDYAGSDCSTTVRPYRRDQVSLPDPGRPSADLLSTLPEPDQDLLKSWDTHMLADPADVGFYRESGHQFRLYFDEIFKAQRGVYVEFLKDLSDAKMIGWTEKPLSLVTPFFVVKKHDRLRLIMDCRNTNPLFRAPPAPEMGTAAAWGNLERPEARPGAEAGGADASGSGGSKLWVAQADVKDCFHCVRNLPELCPYFCTPPITEGERADAGIGGPSGLGDLAREVSVYPMLLTLPMGFSWAFYFVQRLVEHQCRVSLAGAGLAFKFLRDQAPAPDLGTQLAVLPYCDNINVAGIRREEVKEAKDVIVRRLRFVQFTVHEETEPETLSYSLGRVIDGESWVVRNRSERGERLRKVCEALEGGQPVTGRQMKQYLGHVVDFFLIGREALSVLRACYDFAQAPEDLEVNPGFDEIPEAFMDPDKWHEVFAMRFRKEEAIPILEGAVERISGPSRESRREKRQSIFGAFERLALSGQHSILERHSITAPTEGLYTAWWEELQDFVAMNGCTLDSVRNADIALVDFADYLFLEGFERPDLMKMYAAAAWHLAGLSPIGKLRFPRFSRAARGLGLLAPAQTVPPVPFEVVCWIAWHIYLRLQDWTIPLCLLTMFVCYFRPVDVHSLREEDLVPPGGSSSHWVLNVHPARRGETSKVGVSDEALLLDSPYLPGLGPALHRRRRGQRLAKLFEVSERELSMQWGRSQEQLGLLPSQRRRLYQIRHAGPPHDILMGVRTLLDVKRRGRWSSDATVKRCEAAGVVQQEWAKLSTAQQAAASRAAEWMQSQELYCGTHGILDSAGRQGIGGVGWDTEISSKADLSSAAVIRSIARDFKAGENRFGLSGAFAALWVGIVCST
ncbi:unnamed protein product, partial [Prorocentrum cordatum]